MRSLHVLILCAASLFVLLPACGPAPDAPDGAVADAGHDATTPIDAADDDASMVELDAGEDASVTEDGGDAAVELDGSVDAGVDAFVPECAEDEDCDDGDECTVDTCTVGLCDAAPIDPNDGDLCTTDACDPATGVSHVAVSIDDADICTADACDATGGISHTPIDDCCETTADCGSGVCLENVCQPASCADGTQNGSETDVDCGGAACAPCALSLGCAADTDCQSTVCAAGACVECAAASDCPGADTDCRTRTCVANACGVSFAAAGTATTSQLAADCRENQCDGAGNVVDAVLDTDLPVDASACTNDVCTAGVASNPPASAGTACGAGGLCDGSGACQECLTASDCSGTDSECAMRTCTAGTCGVAFTSAGTPVASQIAGDCRQSQCNGAGNVVDAVLDTDLPVDASACTNDVCTAGVASNPPASAGTACGSGVCDGSGACQECLIASDCSGTDSECAMRTCTAGTCGVAFTSAGTAVASQIAGDCQQSQCDGAGNVVDAALDTDLPVDASACTNDVCTAGIPSNPPASAGTACGAGGLCDGSGACQECLTASDCSGTDGECAMRTCTAGTCGVAFTSVGTPVASQIAGDCQVSQCDGAGGIESVASSGDVPADDGNQCTRAACVAGVPNHVSEPSGAACNESGGTQCDGAGSCVECVTASDCSVSNECQLPTCNAGSCGVANAPAGTPVASQTAGDCQVSQCNGAGGIESVASDLDVPADDGNQCTSAACVAGVPSHVDEPSGALCDQSSGTQCDGAGSCVQCVTAADCAGSDTECAMRTCTEGLCGVAYAAEGVPVTSQTAGDCNENQCDGAGNVESVPSDLDVLDDGNQCTDDMCTDGAGMSVASVAGTACSQDGGTECDGMGACVTVAVVPAIVSTMPADGSSVLASTNVVVTFDVAMDPVTLTAQTSAGACTGAVQISRDSFVTCIAFASATATMTSGDTIATLVPAPGLLINELYELRVTSAATSAAGVALGAPDTDARLFEALSPSGGVVIAQVYGGGGNSGAPYKNDYVVLHNRSAVAVSVAGWSVQYAGASGTSWNPAVLIGSIPAGGYYLVQLGAGTGSAAALPTPDATGSANMGGAAGKVALVATTTALTGACPTNSSIVDFVGFGAANCFEGAGPTPAPSNTTEITRTSCADAGSNSVDFSTGAPTPRNSASPLSSCPGTVLNESGNALEADYCVLQFPTSLTVATGAATDLVFGRVFEAGVTEAAGADAAVRAQLGYGPISANPQYEAGWSWTDASFNTQYGNDDEYQASFTAPAAGSYHYAYRVSLDSGATWTLCDLDGAGSNTGASFELDQLGVLTVTP